MRRSHSILLPTRTRLIFISDLDHIKTAVSFIRHSISCNGPDCSCDRITAVIPLIFKTGQSQMPTENLAIEPSNTVKSSKSTSNFHWQYNRQFRNTTFNYPPSIGNRYRIITLIYLGNITNNQLRIVFTDNFYTIFKPLITKWLSHPMPTR